MKLTIEQIKDRRGTLRRVLAEPCMLGRPLRNCPLMEWRRRDGVEMMTEALICNLLQKHLDCGV
jgi:hypothetical protein